MQFDGWTVNRVSGEISREGRASRLPQQPLRILIELFDHAGEVVTREQLVKVLWPAGVVDFDNGLNVAMRKLRVALDDVGETPRYIETLPRVGYRFIGKQGGGAVATPALAPVPAPKRLPRRALLGVAGLIVALAAAAALSWWVSSRNEGPRHVPSERAQELYLEGLQLRSRRDINTGDMARAKFIEALKEDPEFAQAWAVLGENYSVAVIRQEMLPSVGVPKARAAAQRAIALDDTTVEAHYVLGGIYMDHDKDFAAAKAEYDRAMQLNNRSARLWHHLAMWHGQMGHIEESLAALRRARELEPMTLLYSGNYGLMLYEARRYDEAIAFLRPLVEANPAFDQAHSMLARALLATGDAAGALAELQARKRTEHFVGDLGVVYAKLGRRDDALREIEALDARARAGYGVAYETASIYVALGDLDKGCELLARALTDDSILVNWMRVDPRMDALRGRQCFADVEKKLFRK